jgi:hypothetical protein
MFGWGLHLQKSIEINPNGVSGKRLNILKQAEILFGSLGFFVYISSVND